MNKSLCDVSCGSPRVKGKLWPPLCRGGSPGSRSKYSHRVLASCVGRLVREGCAEILSLEVSDFYESEA